MTRLTVTSGICGFSTRVTAEMQEGGKEITVKLESDCEMIAAMGKELEPLDKMCVFTGFPTNPAYRAAAKHLKHTACPVPSGIIKALEVEAGFCLPKDASIVFEK